MNNGSSSKKARKPVSQNTKNKISKSVKNAYNRNKAAANSLGLNVKTYRSMKKAGTKKNGANGRPKTPNFNPFNEYLNLMPAPAPGAPNPFNQFNTASVASASTSRSKKANLSANNVAKRAKMSNAQKSSAASSSWMANVKKVQNMLGVPRREAMVIASTKRKEKAGTAKSKNNNANLLGFGNLSLSNKKSPPKNASAAKKYNENVMAALGM